LTLSSRSHYGPGVDSAWNKNEYQENTMVVSTAGAYCWQPYHLPVPLSRNLGTLTSWNPLGHSRPVTGLIYLFYLSYFFHFYSSFTTYCVLLPLLMYQLLNSSL